MEREKTQIHKGQSFPFHQKSAASGSIAFDLNHTSHASMLFSSKMIKVSLKHQQKDLTFKVSILLFFIFQSRFF